MTDEPRHIDFCCCLGPAIALALWLVVGAAALWIVQIVMMMSGR